MNARSVAVSAAIVWAAFMSFPPAAPAKLFSRSPSAGQTAEPVAEGIIVWSNREGTQLILGSGLHLIVPVSLPGVVHTELKPGRPIKAYYKKEGSENVVTLMFVRGVHPGSGG